MGTDSPAIENTAQENLRAGATWGSIWSTLYTKYKTGNEEQDKALATLLDNTLDKSTWAKEGAYSAFKKSGSTSVI